MAAPAHVAIAEDSFSRKCKIIGTMGPASWDVDVLVQLIDAGINVCRLPVGGNHEAHVDAVKRIREAAKQRPGTPVAILCDTKGREIETGLLKEDLGGKVELTEGQKLRLVTDMEFKGDSSCIAVSYDKLCQSVKPGNTIVSLDRSLCLKVESVADDHVITEVVNNVSLSEGKKLRIPGVVVELPILHEQDKDALVNFAIPQGVDFVAASGVRSAEDVRQIRQALGMRGKYLKLLSKVDTEAGVKNIDEIVDVSDGVLVDSELLGFELSSEGVAAAQKSVIAKCNQKGKPVVTVAQSVSKASDAASSVLDGADAVLLVDAGDAPVDAVKILRSACQAAEASIDYAALHQALVQSIHEAETSATISQVEAVCSAAIKAAIDTGASVIVALTETGHTAQLLAKYRPQVPILAMSASETTIRQLLLVRGVTPVLTASFAGTDAVIAKAMAKAKEVGMSKSGDTAVAVQGTREECPGHSNLMKMVTVH